MKTQQFPSSGSTLWRRRLRALLPAFMVLVFAVAVVGYLMGSRNEAGRTKPHRVARLVETVTLTSADHAITIEAWGSVAPARRVTLQPQVAGEVRKAGANFEPGALMVKGELLLQIDPADYELAVRQRLADLTRARAELALEKGRREVAEQEYALVKGEVTEEQRRLILREPQLDSTRSAVAAAKAMLATAELDLARTAVHAPFNALVLEQQVDVGTRVSNATVLATLVDTDVFWVELAVPAASLRWIEVPGATVRLYHEQVWGPEVYREGRVIRLRGDLDEKGRMARLLVAVPDPLAIGEAKGRPRLLLGAFLRAEVLGRSLNGAVAVDRNWLRDGDTLWVMDGDDRLAIRPVEVLYRGPQQVYVRDGIEAGERIVTSDLAVPAAGLQLRTAKPLPAEAAVTAEAQRLTQ